MPRKHPLRETDRTELDIIRRTRFYNAYDTRPLDVSFAELCRREDINIKPPTGRYLLSQREKLGDIAYRRTRKLAHRLGRLPAIPEKTLDELLDVNDPAHALYYEDQVKAKHLRVKPYTLQQAMTKRRGARRFKKPYTKAISKDNKLKRQLYRRAHRNKTILGFWRWVVFTNEKHFNSRDLLNKAEYKLRQPGAAIRLERLHENTDDGLNITLHVAGCVN
jgi:hypothetical protein